MSTPRLIFYDNVLKILPCEVENDENAKYCDQCGEKIPTNEVEND